MKIHILYSFRQGAWGGGNQFLNVLRKFLKHNESYTDDSISSNVVLVNSYQEIARAIFLKYRYPHKWIIHRLGPIFSYHRGRKWHIMDKLVVFFANNIADGVIFQSQWSCNESKKLGFSGNNNEIIPNAVDSSIFYPRKLIGELPKKTRLIATSWSKNANKGFELLTFLDDNLDFTRYSMKFIGNTPVSFKNIQIIQPQPSAGVAEQLRLSDIYISTARFEACSNALLEAIACDLPVVFLNSGGNSEIVKNGGESFCTKQEFISSIDKVSNNYKHYQDALPIIDLQEVGEKYITFFKKSMKVPARKVAKSVLLFVYVKYFIINFSFKISDYLKKFLIK